MGKTRKAGVQLRARVGQNMRFCTLTPAFNPTLVPTFLGEGFQNPTFAIVEIVRVKKAVVVIPRAALCATFWSTRP